METPRFKEEPETIMARFNKEHTGSCGDEALLLQKLRRYGLTDRQLAGVVVTLEEVCHECWDAVWDCQCGNDS